MQYMLKAIIYFFPKTASDGQSEFQNNRLKDCFHSGDRIMDNETIKSGTVTSDCGCDIRSASM